MTAWFVFIGLLLLLAAAGIWLVRKRRRDADGDAGEERTQQEQWILLLFPGERTSPLAKEITAFIGGRMGFKLRHLGDLGGKIESALRRYRPSLVLAHQPTFGDEIASLEQESSVVASIPILYLDAHVIRAGSTLRASLPRNARMELIASAVVDLLNRRPGPKELSRRELVQVEIEPGNVMEFLHFLHTMQKSGKIEIRTRAITGTAWMLDGRIVHAAVGNLEGLDALHSVLDFVHGTITFAPGGAPQRQTIRDGAMSVLAEYARHRDELAKASRN